MPQGRADRAVHQARTPPPTASQPPPMEALDQILFPVVLCTQDEARRASATRLIRNLGTHYARNRLNILVFDNASAITSPLDETTFPHVLVRSSVNVGYWSALKWVMDHHRTLFGRTFEFVHPIESDFVLFHIERLRNAQRFLERYDDFACVRTQKFRVRFRQFYFKQSPIPRFLKSSVVADYNGVTREKVAFRKAEHATGVYCANWHAKVPALHRMAVLGDVLLELSAAPVVTEEEFMKSMFRRAREVGVLDGGVWSMNLANPKGKGVTGSYSKSAELLAKDYRNTRMDRMEPDFPEPVVSFET